MGYEDLFHFIDDFGKNFVRPGFLDVIVPATGPPYTGLGTQHAQMGEFSQALLYFTAELYHSFSGPYWKNMAAILGDLAARRMERARKPERSGFLLLRMQLQVRKEERREESLRDFERKRKRKRKRLSLL